MKKTLLLLACAIGLITLAGCSKDDTFSSGENSTKSIKIKWYGLKTPDKPITRGVADEGNLWNQRVGIYVKFLNAPKDRTKLERVRQIAAEWEQYAGIKLHFVNGDAKANVRIAFDWNGNDWLTWSYTGTQAQQVTDQTQPTAVLAGSEYSSDKEFEGDVLRLFGQILGLEYEQRHPDWTFWKSESQLQNYWKSMFEGMNMDWDQISEYVFIPLTAQNGIHTLQTDNLDELSIMAWPYYQRAQTSKLLANYKLSEGDKKFIAQLYPKDKQILPTIQEAWIDTGFFEWQTRENYEGGTWTPGVVCLKMTQLGVEQQYFPDVSDGEQLTSTSTMFYNFKSKYINHLVKAPSFNTSNVTDFSGMFSYCSSLTSVPQYDTSNGTSFSAMFDQCNSLTNIPLLNTSKGKDFSAMFSNCHSLVTVPQLNTSKGLAFNYMFIMCHSLSTVTLFDTSNSKHFEGMFSGCSSLVTIPLFDTSKGELFSGMFGSCTSLVTIPLINTSNGGSFSGMFSGCSSLVTIPLIDTSNGGSFSDMFGGCTSLVAIPNINTSSAISFNKMFSGCTSLVTKPSLDLSHAKNTEGMYEGTPFDDSL